MARTNTRAQRARNKRILTASDVCHICGKPGADAIDHVTPLARGGTDELANLKPAHHDVAPFCNRIKGAKAYAPIVKRSGSLD
jgi:5-methylcytosine-specific restriction endonuclease McrA